MDVDSEQSNEDWMPALFVGWHSTQQRPDISSHFVEQARECNYDMITTSITNANFQSRVVGTVSNAFVDPAPGTEAQSDGSPLLIPPLSAEDTELKPADFNARLLGFTSSWIDLCSPDPVIADVSRQVLHMEVAYAAFCGLGSVFVAGPRLYHDDAATQGLAPYALAIEQALPMGANLSLSCVFSMVDDPSAQEPCILAGMTRPEFLDNIEAERPRKVDNFGTWDAWSFVRIICSHSSRLFAALELPKTLPSPAVQSRWLSEPIKALIIPATSFVANRSGYPTLFPHTQTFLGSLFRLKTTPWILLRNAGPIPGADDPHAVIELPDGFLPSDAKSTARGASGAHETALLQARTQKDPLAHLRYLRYLQRNQPKQTPVECYGAGYQDYLQVPLQPLAQNLESLTYEVFEKDPVKYDLYEEALRRALRDWVDQKKPTSGPNGRILVAVVGAGRGPLVTRALHAAETERVSIELWAVEKNPHAFVLLQRRNRDTWGGRVRLACADMRGWPGPQMPQAVDKKIRTVKGQVDVLVSELLGSFGDNELSPECLDGVRHHLASQGISIPRNYTALLTPVAAPKIHAHIAQCASYDSNAAETPAVVWLHGIDYLSTSAQNAQHSASASYASAARPSTDDGSSATPATVPPVMAPNVLTAWSFTHGPQKSIAESGDSMVATLNARNRRHTRLTFRCAHRGVCHGLAGYFEAELYPGVSLSTNPNTMAQHSKDMISWFPFFFPLKTPIYVPDNAALTVSMWRQTDGKKVWYEWLVESWGWTFMLAEKDSRRVRLGMSELHSSAKSAYLM